MGLTVSAPLYKECDFKIASGWNLASRKNASMEGEKYSFGNKTDNM